MKALVILISVVVAVTSSGHILSKRSLLGGHRNHHHGHSRHHSHQEPRRNHQGRRFGSRVGRDGDHHHHEETNDVARAPSTGYLPAAEQDYDDQLPGYDELIARNENLPGYDEDYGSGDGDQSQYGNDQASYNEDYDNEESSGAEPKIEEPEDSYGVPEQEEGSGVEDR